MTSLLGTNINTLFYSLTSIEMASTLQQLNLRINKFTPRRSYHIARILNRIFQTDFSSEQIRVRLENWTLLLPLYNDHIRGKSVEELEEHITNYYAIQYENHSACLLNCFIPLITQCINLNCSENDLDDPIPYHDVTIFCSGERLKKGTMFFKRCSRCRYKYFYNYYLRLDGQKILTMHSDDEIFVIFSNCGYEKRLLRQIDSDICSNTACFRILRMLLIISIPHSKQRKKN